MLEGKIKRADESNIKNLRKIHELDEKLLDYQNMTANLEKERA